MKRILMVAYHYPPEASSSGMLRTLKFSKYLPAYGWSPHILTLRASAYVVRDDSLLSQVPAEVAVHRSRSFDLARRLSLMGRYPGFLAVPDRFVAWLPFGLGLGLKVMRVARPSVLYSTSPHPTAHLIAGALNRLTRTPWIADFRDPWIEERYPAPGSARRAVEAVLERYVVTRADRITVTTPRFREDLLRRYPELGAHKVRVIFNGYDETDFAGSEEPRVRGDRFEILHAGMVTPEYRDPRPALDAVASLVGEGLVPPNRVKLVFLGGGPYLSSARFTEQVRRLGLGRVVDVTPRLPYGETLARLCQASVLLLLQASDDTRSLIPAKAFEYLRAGRPILALTPEGATAELIRSTMRGVTVMPGDGPGIARALRDLYADRWKPDGPCHEGVAIARYERRALTGELARLLDELS